MPPYGLYPIPRHRFSPHTTTPKYRRIFNSMDFADAEPAREAAAKNKTETAEQRAQRKLEKRQRKAEKRLKKERKAQAEQYQNQQQQLVDVETEPQGQHTDATPSVTQAETEPQAQHTDSTPVATPVKNGQYGPRGPYKKREKATDEISVSAVKRKRESEVQTAAPSGSSNDVDGGRSLLDPNFLTALKEKMGNMGSVFKQMENEEEEPAKKKRGRLAGWRKNADAESVKTETPNGSESVVSTPASTKVPGSTLNKSFKMIRTPVPVPSVASRLFSSVKKTPVPVRQKPSPSTSGSMSELQTGERAKVHPADVLMTETPPSRMRQTPVTTPRQSAIPFPHLGALLSSSKSPMVKKKDIVSSQGSVNPLTSSQASMDPLPSTHPPAFTASTLFHYKQRLNEKPKARPRCRQRAFPKALSTSSSSTSTAQSMLDMLARIPKPYSSTFDNPFSSKKKQSETKKKEGDKHVEADRDTFNRAFKVIQRTVNFSDEEEYLAAYQGVLEESKKVELPCLKSATGCSVRVHSPSSSSFSPAAAVEKMDQDTQNSIQRAETAEAFLRHAIMARVPVPLGRIEGVWRLFCKEYTGVHVDKYSAGLRTLTITSPSSYQGTPVYTARLHIPPRSMAFASAPFTAPPHAGFRATRMKTVQEGYAMEVLFWGNGYARVRADVGLLLSGKGGAGGQIESVSKNKAYGIWHFLAVHERALFWEPKVDELEVESRKLFAAYDGIVE